MARNGFKMIDAEMHVIEPVDLWERYIDPEFKARAPRRLSERRWDIRAVSVSDMNAVSLAGTRQTREGAGRTSGVGHPDRTFILRHGPDLRDPRAPWSRRHSGTPEHPGAADTEAYRAWSGGGPFRAPDRGLVGRFDRSRLAGQLAPVLDAGGRTSLG